MTGPDRLRELAEDLVAALPPGLAPDAVRVERARGLGDLLGGRPARLTLLEIRDDDLVLRLAEVDGPDGAPRLVPWLLRVVHGVAISHRRVTPRQWFAQVERTLHGMAEETSRAEAAVHRLLLALGSGEPSAGVDVDDGDVTAGLATLAARLPDRVPPDVQETVGRIADTLRRALRTADDERQHWLIRRIATDYLPTTLRVFLEVPADWTDPDGIADGRAPLDLLREQLAVLEAGTEEAYQAALADDAARLLANGAFLRDRFTPPGPPPP